MGETKRGEILEAINEARSAILKASHNHEQAIKALVKLGFEAVLEELKQLAEAIKPKPQPIITGGDFMFVLPDDQPDVPFSVSPVSAADSEGHAIALTENLVSDNEDVIGFVFADGSSASNPRTGVAHVGAPGIANVNYTAIDSSGNIVKSTGSQFTVTTGAVASTTGGDIAFEGITEQP